VVGEGTHTFRNRGVIEERFEPPRRTETLKEKQKSGREEQLLRGDDLAVNKLRNKLCQLHLLKRERELSVVGKERMKR